MTAEAPSQSPLTQREIDLAAMFGFIIRDRRKEFGTYVTGSATAKDKPMWVVRAVQPTTDAECHMWAALLAGEANWPVDKP